MFRRHGARAIAMVLCLAANAGDAQELQFDTTLRLTGFADASTGEDAQTLLTGRLDAFVNVTGLWDGGSLNAHLEYVDGNDFLGLGAGGVIWPTNVYAAVPRGSGDNNASLSLTFSHRFSDAVSLSLGKFNVVDLADKTPLAGGRGAGGFQYTGIAAPPSFVFPPYVLGASLAVTTERVNYSLLIYDANNAQGEAYWDDVFADGVVFNGSATYKATAAGLPGFYTANLVWSTKESTDFTSGESGSEFSGFLERTDGVGFATFKFQQYLSYDPTRPDQGWGIFGQASVGADGSQIDNVFVLGLAGTSPIEGRGDDRWGIAGAIFQWSDGLIDGIEASGGGLRDEWAVEAFYEAEITDTLRIGVNAMQVQPGIPTTDDFIQFGLRLRATF